MQITLNARRIAVAVLAVATLPAVAAEQNWPTRAVRVIVPFTVGSSADILARMVTDPLTITLGQPFVVENRGGAGGTIGAGLVAKSDPDGYTLLAHAAAHSAAPAAYPNAAYDAAKDFSAIAMIGVVPNVIAVNPKKNIKTLKELIAAAKTQDLSFSSAGVASASHWGVERVLVAAGVRAVHVPYKGGPEALLDVVTGRVDFLATGVTSASPYIKDGRLIALAVSTPKRSSVLPEVPTVAEAGLPGAEYIFWDGFLAPSKTPRPIIDRMSREVQKILATPAVKERMTQLGVEPMPLTPAEFDAMIRKEIDENIKLVKAAGLKFD